VTAVRSVFSLIALMMLVTLMTAITSFHTALAQPVMMDGTNMNIGSSGGGAGMDFNPISLQITYSMHRLHMVL
jgi:hypothetical protein